jgi:ribosomal protein L3
MAAIHRMIERLAARMLAMINGPRGSHRNQGGCRGQGNRVLRSETFSQANEVGQPDRTRKDHRVLLTHAEVSITVVAGG